MSVAQRREITTRQANKQAHKRKEGSNEKERARQAAESDKI